VKVTLQIESGYDKRDVTVENEISIGRSDASNIVLDDAGLSRKNTSFFIDEGEVFVADEGSLNGTAVNGEKVNRPRALKNGDVVKIGSNTSIRVLLGDGARVDDSRNVGPEVKTVGAAVPISAPQIPTPQSQIQNPKSSGPPIMLVAAITLTVLIIAFGVVALLIVKYAGQGTTTTSNGTKPPQIRAGALIPVRVIDPLGGEDEDDLDDLMASWETAEEEIKADNVSDITGGTADEEKELNVTAAFLAERQKKAFEPRPGEGGIRPAGLDVPKELFGDGVIKQKQKLAAMNTGGYKQPLDFAELAETSLRR